MVNIKNYLYINKSLKFYKIRKLILILILLVLIFIYFLISNKNKNKKLVKEINKIYKLKNYVNINEVESFIPGGRKWEKKEKKNEINVGIQLDPKYTLRVMMTLASIIDSQKPETKLRFHFAVVLSFRVEHMLKIYTLRERMRDDVEFNFYNAKKVEIDLSNVNTKGPGAVAKLLLPNLLPKNVEKLNLYN